MKFFYEKSQFLEQLQLDAKINKLASFLFNYKTSGGNLAQLSTRNCNHVAHIFSSKAFYNSVFPSVRQFVTLLGNEIYSETIKARIQIFDDNNPSIINSSTSMAFRLVLSRFLTASKRRNLMLVRLIYLQIYQRYSTIWTLVKFEKSCTSFQIEPTLH